MRQSKLMRNVECGDIETRTWTQYKKIKTLMDTVQIAMKYICLSDRNLNKEASFTFYTGMSFTAQLSQLSISTCNKINNRNKHLKTHIQSRKAL